MISDDAEIRRISEATRSRMQQKGLSFTLPDGPLTVRMVDDIVHTAAFPVCDDPECICYPLEMERVRAEEKKQPKKRRNVTKRSSSQRHENTGFRLLR